MTGLITENNLKLLRGFARKYYRKKPRPLAQVLTLLCATLSVGSGCIPR